MDRVPSFEETIDRARLFVTRQGRPLERARWLAFEGASPDAVVEVLAAYQNPDGGFGHAIEPDYWNPESTPIQTWAAMEILREVGCSDGHPLMERLLSWLKGQFEAGKGFPTAVPGNNAHPHAPWWSFEETDVPSHHSEWNPQAALAGFAWARSAPGSRLADLAGVVLVRAAASFASNAASIDPHGTACFVTMADEVRGAGRTPPFDLEALDHQLNRAAEHWVEPDATLWFSSYCCRPSQLLHAPHPRWSPRLIDLARQEARLLPSVQDEEGTWPVTWAWAAYSESWPVARAWWRGILAVQNSRFLKRWT